MASEIIISFDTTGLNELADDVALIGRLASGFFVRLNATNIGEISAEGSNFDQT